MNYKVKNICWIALLVALNIILSRVLSIRIIFLGIEGIRIGFGILPVIIAGLLLGKRQGFITGIIGDILGFQLSSSGLYFPTFTLIAGLNGVLSPLMINRFFNGIISLPKLVMIIAINNIITSLILTPLFLQLHFGISAAVIVPGIAISQIIIIPCMAIMINILIKRLKKSGISTQCLRHIAFDSEKCTAKTVG